MHFSYHFNFYLLNSFNWKVLLTREIDDHSKRFPLDHSTRFITNICCFFSYYNKTFLLSISYESSSADIQSHLQQNNKAERSIKSRTGIRNIYINTLSLFSIDLNQCNRKTFFSRCHEQQLANAF